MIHQLHQAAIVKTSNSLAVAWWNTSVPEWNDPREIGLGKKLRRLTQIAGALQPWRTPASYRLLAVPQPSPQGGVPFPRAAPRCAWRFLSNTSAVVSTCPSLRSHNARDRQSEFGVLPGFHGQLFAASRGDLV